MTLERKRKSKDVETKKALKFQTNQIMRQTKMQIVWNSQIKSLSLSIQNFQLFWLPIPAQKLSSPLIPEILYCLFKNIVKAKLIKYSWRRDRRKNVVRLRINVTSFNFFIYKFIFYVNFLHFFQQNFFTFIFHLNSIQKLIINYLLSDYKHIFVLSQIKL